MDNQSQPCMFYQSKYEVMETVLGLEMWIWDLDAPMDGIGGKKGKKQERRKEKKSENRTLGNA